MLGLAPDLLWFLKAQLIVTMWVQGQREREETGEEGRGGGGEGKEEKGPENTTQWSQSEAGACPSLTFD